MEESRKISRSGVSETLRSVAEDLNEGSPQEQTIAQAIDSIANASEALRDKDANDAIQAIDKFARRNPLVFIGAAALVGFAATRLVKAVQSDEVSVPEAALSDVQPREEAL